ncbi:hypothetical protein AXG94_26210 [Pseudomonas corrugata]|nr:hypothetical protein AXG94_26210 [Pseudomonas corrugata]
MGGTRFGDSWMRSTTEPAQLTDSLPVNSDTSCPSWVCHLQTSLRHGLDTLLRFQQTLRGHSSVGDMTFILGDGLPMDFATFFAQVQYRQALLIANGPRCR